MENLPIFLNIRERKCVVIGGGEVAFRKARLLARANASLVVVADALNADMEALCHDYEATVLRQRFDPEILSGAALVIAATDDEDVNRRVSEAARKLHIPVNVVDQPRLCTFIVPAIVDRSPIVIAVSSGGSSPILTRKLKELNEIMVPDRTNKLAAMLRRWRKPVQKTITDFESRIRFWESVLDSELPELVYSGNESEAEVRLQHRLKHYAADSSSRSNSVARVGEVYLVGAGPGDPDLLTLRALRLMHKADVVLYDRLVSPEILTKIRPDADRIHVGKQRSNHAVPQHNINELLVSLAQEGKRVLRLKGGDPFIFGRGGEELASLAEAGIPFQVVPGITAASGCAAYAGIPLTHRDHAQSVRFLPGHLKEGTLELEWQYLVKEQQTLVFYMGLVGLPTICERLLAHGMAPDMPAAIIQQGTTAKQRVVTASLSRLPVVAEQAQLKAPTLIIIGSVVTLREQLEWFDDGESSACK